VNRVRSLTVLGILLSSLAFADPPTEIDYQGRITIGKQPFTGTGYFKYAITCGDEGTNFWSNDGTATGEPAAGCAQAVTEGRFSTLLGAAPMAPIDPAALTGGDACFFRVWFSQDGASFRELKPKQKLASSPFAVNAARLGGKDRAYFENAGNLASGSVPDERLSASVTKLGPTIGGGEIDEGGVGTREIADGSVKLEDLNLSELDARYARAGEGAGQQVAGAVDTLCVSNAVGIGVSQPGAALHVAGTARFENGIHYVHPVGDLQMGVYTNSP
jgi:hypothetical protein